MMVASVGVTLTKPVVTTPSSEQQSLHAHSAPHSEGEESLLI
jgi:hypothetical protein